jgi:hypothetical protein
MWKRPEDAKQTSRPSLGGTSEAWEFSNVANGSLGIWPSSCSKLVLLVISTRRAVK